ncbi:MAG: hypothetical protein NTY74_10720 [Ignavibacteriae bacterium]|nr:hypothetical protein [Ignavibacteriota bacterium]
MARKDRRRNGTRMTLKERIFADRDFLGLKTRKDNSGLPVYE